jgi:glycosyltransferase involved in cell wall biosynthesis
MRILQIVHSRDPGGVLTLANSIARGLEEHGICVETAFMYPETKPRKHRRLWQSLRLARKIMRGSYDGVIAYQATASIVTGVVGRLRGIRHVIVHQTSAPHVTAAPVRLIDKIIGTLGIYRTNITNSRATHAEFDAYPARYRQSLILIEHGVTPPTPSRARPETWALHQVPDDGPILLNTGRLASQKNQQILIRALPSVPRARLVIAGAGPLEAEYRALAQSLDVGDRVHLLGALGHAEIANLYAASDLLVFPSTTETFGISAVEAVLLKCPAIVADLPVLREVLSLDGTSEAVFVPPHDLAGWIDAISRMINDPPTPTRLASYAGMIGAKYSEARMVESYIRLLTEASYKI